MKYVLSNQNVHMYCYRLTIKDEKNTYEAIIEASASKNKTMLIWLEDFNFPTNEVECIKEEIEKYFAMRNIDCIFEPGKRV